MNSGDLQQFRQCLGRLATQAQAGSQDFKTAVIEELAPLLPDLGGVFAKVAVLVGACVEWGGSPLPLRDALPERAARAMEDYARFPAAWSQATGGQPLPDRQSPPPMRDVQQTLVNHSGLEQEDATSLAVSWFDVDDWLMPLITVMAMREFRTTMAHRARVREAAAAIADNLQQAYWVHGLAEVLDDEPLIVLDRASGRGFHLTMSGIGDNFQLHTLLADRLIDNRRHGLIDGEPPKLAWMAAATFALPRRPTTDPIVRRFRLFDGRGAYVSPEGRPADIAPLEGIRVLAVHPPLGHFAWIAGRIYEHMSPTLTLDRIMEPGEAADWLSRIAPAQEDDLMAINHE